MESSGFRLLVDGWLLQREPGEIAKLGAGHSGCLASVASGQRSQMHLSITPLLPIQAKLEG